MTQVRILPALLLSSISLASTNAMSESWYVDAVYTQSHGELRNFPFDETENTDDGWQLNVGYQVNNNFSIEFGYVDLGQQSSELSPMAFIAALPPPGTTYNPITKAKTVFETTGIRIATVGSLPLTNVFSLDIQAGALIPKYVNTNTAHFNTYDSTGLISSGSYKASEESNEPELFFGLGVEANITSSIGLKLSWEKYLDVGNQDTSEQDIDTYNLAFRFRF